MRRVLAAVTLAAVVAGCQPLSPAENFSRTCGTIAAAYGEALRQQNAGAIDLETFSHIHKAYVSAVNACSTLPADGEPVDETALRVVNDFLSTVPGAGPSLFPGN